VSTSRPVTVLFLIRSLGSGGAERQLIELVRYLDPSNFAPIIATFYDGGDLRAEAERIPWVKVVSLGKAGRWDTRRFLSRLVRLARQERPEIIHGYLSIANELALAVGRLTGARTVWGIGASDVDFSKYDWTFTAAFKAGALLSSYPDRIIVNSDAGRRYHAAAGYDDSRMRVVHNGIDTERFRADVAARRRLRRQWQIGEEDVLIGIVGRLDPMKDHESFLKSAALVRSANKRSRFVCIGAGTPEERARLEGLSASLGLGGVVTWAGFCDDMVAAYSAVDMLVSSSITEGLSNAIAEAMACSVVCVVTDVGDSAAVVGDTGIVVPPSSPDKLAKGVHEMLSLSDEERLSRGRSARRRIQSRYGVHRLATQTEGILLELLH
jgi:glycosyltransferase involved in cell wall biosynthesis